MGPHTHTHIHTDTHTQQFSVTDNDSLARNTSHLGMALQAECLSRFAQLSACEELDWEIAEAKGRKAIEISGGLPSQLPRLLQKRRRPLQAQAHVALGCALLSLQKEEEPKGQAVKARGQLNTVELGPLARLFEAEQARREQAPADLLASCRRRL
jgi:hypothetical protein